MTKPQEKNLFRIFLFLGTIVSLNFVPWPILVAWIKPLPATIELQMEDTIDYGFDGIIVYIDTGDKNGHSYTSGYKNREHKSPADPHALFKIASIGKLYDAVAVTKLVNDQRLDLDATLSEYLPELRGRIAHADRITLRMLVQHRSGIPNLTDTPDFWTAPPKNSKEALDRVLDLPARFEPDTEYEYSNTNYLLITEIIEKLLGYRKFRYIHEKILVPLDLKNTFGSLKDVNIDDVMSGYYVGVEEDIKSVDYGSMLATAEDVGKFVRALNNGTLLSQEEQNLYSQLYELEHVGLVPGYQSIARYHDDIDAVVIQFLNTTDFDGYHWNLSEISYSRILRILRNNRSVK